MAVGIVDILAHQHAALRLEGINIRSTFKSEFCFTSIRNGIAYANETNIANNNSRITTSVW